MLNGIGGFIAIGYICGLIVGAATIADMTSASRSAWRKTGNRRRTSVTVVIISWFILGWGAVLAGIIWFAGNTRAQVRISYIDEDDSNQNYLEQESDPEPGPRQMDFLKIPGGSAAESSVSGTLKKTDTEIDIVEVLSTE